MNSSFYTFKKQLIYYLSTIIMNLWKNPLDCNTSDFYYYINILRCKIIDINFKIKKY